MVFFFAVVMFLVVALVLHFVVWSLRENFLDLFLTLCFIGLALLYGVQSMVAKLCNALLGTRYPLWIEDLA